MIVRCGSGLGKVGDPWTITSSNYSTVEISRGRGGGKFATTIRYQLDGGRPIRSKFWAAAVHLRRYRSRQFTHR
jgi:hypothetical protein